MPLKDGGYKLEDVYLRLRVSFSYFSSFSSQEEREVKEDPRRCHWQWRSSATQLERDHDD